MVKALVTELLHGKSMPDFTGNIGDTPGLSAHTMPHTLCPTAAPAALYLIMEDGQSI